MIKLKLYRHTYLEDVFLARNWNFCGGGHTTPFYYATKDVMVAIKDANRAEFMGWAHGFLGEDGKTMLVAKMTDSIEVDIDGYKGRITKELVFPVKEFRLVELAEVE